MAKKDKGDKEDKKKEKEDKQKEKEDKKKEKEDKKKEKDDKKKEKDDKKQEKDDKKKEKDDKKKEKDDKKKEKKDDKKKDKEKKKKKKDKDDGDNYLSKENIHKELFGHSEKEKLLRIILLCFCLGVVLMALIIIIRARHFGHITKDYRELAENKNEEIFTYFVICGTIALVVALFGVIMALGGVGITLITLIVLVALAIIGQLIFAAMIGIKKNQVRAKVHESILLTTRTYYGFPASHPDIDGLQQKLHCCGYIDHNDYKPSACRPDSCCKTVRYLECSTNYSDLFTDTGCRKAADQQIRMASIEYIIEFLLLVVIEIGVIVVSVLLIRELKKGEEGGGGEGGEEGGGEEGGDKGEEKGEEKGGEAGGD